MSNYRFPFLSDTAYIRPDKTKPEYQGLPEKYFSDFAKWALFNASTTVHQNWLRNTERNKRFYKGDQWHLQEDIENFLQDDSGKERNRIQVVFNQIRPMVEQYRGNAIRLAVNARAKSISNDVKNRRELELKKKLLKTRVAEEFPALGGVLKQKDRSIGDTEEETETIFENTYVDKYVKNLNRLIEYVGELNDMNEMQLNVAQNLVFSGVGTIEETEYNGHLRKEVVQPEEFFWDRNARRYDLQDAAYQGRVMQMNLSVIAEKWNKLSADDLAALERYLSNESGLSSNNYTSNTPGGTTGSSIPVYKTFWLDITEKNYGYVMDDYGQPFLAVINEEEEFANGKVYTEADLISPPESPRNKRLFKNGKKMTKLTVEILRYCIFTPGEAVSYYRTDLNGKKPVDIVYEYGNYEYQETQWTDLSRALYPFKNYCWAYVDGEVFSPIDDVIHPQRFLNRIMSAVEGQINQSGGSNFAYDPDGLDGDYNEDDLKRDVKNGNPIKMRTRGKGMPNTIMPYDNTPKAGTYNLFGLIPAIKQSMQDVTGINEGLKGESTGSDQLVGVTELLIQRGSLMQEPFYNAMAKIFVQSHQYTATVGKKIYIDNQRELNIIVGDDMEVFKLSEDMRNEDFRVFIKRDVSNDSLRQQADAALLTLLQAGIINKEFFASMFQRSTMDDIAVKLRETTKKEMLAAQMQAKEESAAMQQQVAAQEQATNQAMAQAQQIDLDEKILANSVNERDKEHELEKIAVKGLMDAQMKNK